MRFDDTAKRAVDYILHFIGLPYHWGGDDSMEGFDCSGLANEMLKSVGYMGIFEDCTAQDLFAVFKKVDVGQIGVLAFFGTNENHVTHVGVCLNNEQMLEAGGGRSNTLTVQDAINQNAYIKIRPIKSRNDFVGFADPFTERE